jgi:hypothetical protein
MSSAASDVYKRQVLGTKTFEGGYGLCVLEPKVGSKGLAVRRRH